MRAASSPISTAPGVSFRADNAPWHIYISTGERRFYLILGNGEGACVTESA